MNPSAVLNFLARFQSYELVKDVPYLDGPRRRLDVYKPRILSNVPMIVFFYGGSWQTGAKESYHFLASTLAARGYVVIVPDYRVYPEVKFPAFLQDGAEAVRWAYANAAKYGGDSKQLYVMGHSAGAHIAAMLATDEQWLQAVGLSPSDDLAGLIGVSGPYDFLPIKDETLKAIFGGDRRPQTQPVTFAHGSKPPALLMTGAVDTTVEPKNTRSLSGRLREDGNCVTEISYRRFGHISILLGFVPILGRALPPLADIDAFVASTKRAH